MSWSVSARGKKSDVKTQIANGHAPAAIKAHLLQAADTYPHDAEVEVHAYGHVAHSQGDQTTATITVKMMPAPAPKAEGA